MPGNTQIVCSTTKEEKNSGNFITLTSENMQHLCIYSLYSLVYIIIYIINYILFHSLYE